MFLIRWNEDGSLLKNGIGVAFRGSLLILMLVAIHFSTLFVLYQHYYVNLFSGKVAMTLETADLEKGVVVYQKEKIDGNDCIYFEELQKEMVQTIYPSWSINLDKKTMMEAEQLPNKMAKGDYYFWIRTGTVGASVKGAIGLAKEENELTTMDLILLYVKSFVIVAVIVFAAVMIAICIKVVFDMFVRPLFLNIVVFLFLGVRTKKKQKEISK